MPINPNPACPYCGFSSPDNKRYTAREMMFGTKEEFTYSSCNQCHSLFLEKVPQDLGNYYASDYYSLSPLVSSPSWKTMLKKVRETIFRLSNYRLFKPIYGDWWQVLQPSKNAKIADIGCGNGQLLYELHAAGYTNLWGFDPFMSEERVDEGLSLQKKEIGDISSKFDLIMFHHALEHMPNPAQVLNQVLQLLQPNGQLLIRIPVADASVWKEEGVNWVQLDAPRHLHIPSVNGLKSLSKKLGFEVTTVVFDSSEFQFWGTELYKKGIPLNQSDPQKVFTKEELSHFKKKALLYNKQNKGDQACFYLRKLP
ncbi:MAG: class I SAM-dependent methyltransferase [Mongoliitalea sp.]